MSGIGKETAFAEDVTVIDLEDGLGRGIAELCQMSRNEIAHTGEQIREELEGIKKVLQEISNRQEDHLYPYGR